MGRYYPYIADPKYLQVSTTCPDVGPNVHEVGPDVHLLGHLDRNRVIL